MSTMGNNSIKLRLLSLVLAFVMTFTALFQLDGMVYVSAADRYDVAYTATSSDAEKNGLVQDGEYYRYYQDGEPVPGGAWNALAEWVGCTNEIRLLLVHMILLGSFVCNLVLAVIFFAVTEWMMRRNLNLE